MLRKEIERLDAVRRQREMEEDQPLRLVPRRAKVPGQDWCYRCARGPHPITEADHRPVWPSRPSVNGAPAVPLDNWPPQPCEVPDSRNEGDAAVEWQEAAE